MTLRLNKSVILLTKARSALVSNRTQTNTL
jgi:hypothetical protein